MAEIIALQGDLLPPRTAEEVERLCAGHAEAIRVLGKRVITDIIEIGQRLTAVKKAMPHGEWLKWLKKEFAWSHDRADKFMAIADVFGDKLRDSRNLAIGVDTLCLLAGDGVSEEIRDKAIERAKKGERITLAEARKMVAGEVTEEIAAAVQKVRETAERKLVTETTKANERLATLTERLAAATSKTADLSAALQQLHATHDQDVANARAAVEAKYADKLVVSEDELKEQVAALMGPSEKQIAKLEGLLEREQKSRVHAQEQIAALREKLREKHPAKPLFDSDLSMKSLVVRSGIERLRGELKLSPAECIAIELEFSTTFHNRPELAHAKLADMARLIRDVIPWFEEFLRLYPGK